MIVALSTLFMVLGAFVEVLDLSACALASLLVVFVYVEIGSPYTWLVWLATSLATFLLFPGKTVWMLYLLIFGIYPILKAYIERLPRYVWLILKLVYINAILIISAFLVELIFGIPLIAVKKLWMKIGIYLLLNLAFVAYDILLTAASRIYFEKIRNRIRHLLK